MKAHTDKAADQQTDGKTIMKNFFGVVMRLMAEAWKWLKKMNQVWNEGWLVVIGFILWKYSEEILLIVDPTAVPLPVNDLMRFLYATIGTAIAHFVVTVMLYLSHPLVWRYLYGKIYNDLYESIGTELKAHSIKHDLRCIRLKYSLLIFSGYLFTWLVLAATY